MLACRPLPLPLTQGERVFIGGIQLHGIIRNGCEFLPNQAICEVCIPSFCSLKHADGMDIRCSLCKVLNRHRQQETLSASNIEPNPSWSLREFGIFWKWTPLGPSPADTSCRHRWCGPAGDSAPHSSQSSGTFSHV